MDWGYPEDERELNVASAERERRVRAAGLERAYEDAA